MESAICAGGTAYPSRIGPPDTDNALWLQYIPTDGDAPAWCNAQPDTIMYAVDTTWYRARNIECLSVSPDIPSPSPIPSR